MSTVLSDEALAARAAGRATRHGRLCELLDRHGLAGLLLRGAANFAWYTGGGDSRVEHASPVGVADVLITPAHECVVTSTIEAPRMRAEQTPDLEVLEHAWYEDPDIRVRGLTGDGPLGADLPIAGARYLGAEIERLRRVLDPDAVERLRAVGADTVAAFAEAADAIAPGISELDAAAELEAACRRRGLSATVLLAATDERIFLHRHPLPTNAPLERRVMLVASAERGGLYANLTRIVDFDEPTPEVARRIAACEQILRRLREEASRPGRTLAEAFADCRRFYAEAGFPDEWKLHHQGGTTGYGSREVIATPRSDDEIVVGNAFAWNPSITGAKVEETFVLTEHGPEIVAGAAAASPLGAL